MFPIQRFKADDQSKLTLVEELRSDARLKLTAQRHAETDNCMIVCSASDGEIVPHCLMIQLS